MKPYQRKIRSAGGFTLVEVMLAMGVLAVGLAAIASIYPVAIVQQRRMLDEVQGQTVGRNVLAVMELTARDGFPAAADYTPAEDEVIYDGVVNGTTLTSRSGVFDTTGAWAGRYIALQNRTGSYLVQVGSVTDAETLTLANTSPAVTMPPDNDPGDPSEGYYKVAVLAANVKLPLFNVHVPDRGRRDGANLVAVPNEAYDYRVAFRRPDTNGNTIADEAVELAVFVFRRRSVAESQLLGDTALGAWGIDLSATAPDYELSASSAAPGLSALPNNVVSRDEVVMVTNGASTEVFEVVRVTPTSPPAFYVGSRPATAYTAATCLCLPVDLEAIAVVRGVVR